MNNTSPFSFLESIASRFQPPAWVVDEGQQQLVLFLNHVLMQEKQAQDRLLRQKGCVVHVRWGLFAIDLVVTPAGLVDRAPPSAKPDLLLSVVTESPLAVVESVLAGKPPPVKIEGDVQLAAELGWLAENLRWDAEEDLSRLIGDAPAHALADMGRRLLTGLKQFLAQAPQSPESSSSAVASPAPERSAGPPRASSAPSGGSEVREATSVGAKERSAGPPQASSAPSGGSEAHAVASVGANERSAGPPQASSAAARGSQEAEARNLDAQFSDRPPLGKLAPSGGSEDTPVPNVGATVSSVGASVAAGPPQGETAPSGGSALHEVKSVGANTPPKASA